MQQKYAVIKHWDDGQATVEPCNSEDETHRMLQDEADRGFEAYAVQVIGYRPGRNLRLEAFQREMRGEVSA